MPIPSPLQLGAWPSVEGTRFRVWAPHARTVQVVFTGTPTPPLTLERDDDGYWHGLAASLPPHSQYGYRLDDARVLPDPASRFQPHGVHGPSAVIDPRHYAWTDGGWRRPPLGDLVIYELHVGTFAGGGRFADVTSRLEALAALGISAIELMPVAAFAGGRGWGYDGVDLFAPHAAYGTPDDLRALVDRAHALGLAVILDVVYNHLGPDGAYLGTYATEYFHPSHRTPWGAALNLDGPESGPVRDFIAANALHWLSEYHMDGLRLDATHALIDTGPRHLLAELSDRLREVHPDAILTAEDERRLARILRPVRDGGWGFDGLWADDFHHEVRRLLAGDHEGYFASYGGTAAGIAQAIDRGWTRRRDDDGRVEPAPLPAGPVVAAARRPFVICLQNHDQVGNRALGTRLNQDVGMAAFRAASVLLLCAPETPLVFMGQEWGTSTPFLYFTDHERELGAAVTVGRRLEFAAFSAFRDPSVREQIPDPQAPATFERSRLDWSERAREPHASTLRLYAALLALRRSEPALSHPDATTIVRGIEPDLVVLRRSFPGHGDLLVIVRLRGSGPARLDAREDGLLHAGERWSLRLSSEDADVAADARPPRIETAAAGIRITFARPGAVILERSTDVV